MHGFFTRLGIAGATSALVVAGLAGATAPASALGGSLIFAPPPAGIAGVPVTVTMGTGGGTGGQPLDAGTVVQVTPIGSTSGAAAPINVTASGGSITSFTFVPPHVGSWTFQGAGYDSTTSPTMQVNQATVSVAVSAPNTLRVGQAATLTATVTPQGGSQLGVPGQIQFAIAGGANIGAPVWLNQANPSVATIQWTPANVGAVRLQATFTPFKVNGFADVTCGNNCTSPVDTVQVTNTGVNVFLTNPPSFTVGAPGTITAVVSAVPSAGGATFTVNDQVFAANVPVQANGQVSAQWTPSAPGTYTIAVNWTGNSGATGSASEAITVGSTPTQGDSITLTQVGGSTWVPGATYTLQNGQSAAFTAKTASGAAVTLSDSGPCNINGLTVIADQGNGGCILTASSPGGNGYAAASQSYTIQLAPGTQALTFQPRASGPVNRGRTIRLEARGGSDTNAGEPLKWRVVRGANVCQLRFQANGGVTLRTVRNGACRVRATAPAVPGQWNAFSQNFNYRVR